MVTFESRVYTYTPPSTPQTYHLLAPYWTDLYPLGSNGGYVYYRVSGQSDIDKASHDVRTFANIPSFQAKWVLVVTWSTTPFFPKADGPVSKLAQYKRLSMKMKYVQDYMYVVNWFSFDFKKCMIFFNLCEF